MDRCLQVLREGGHVTGAWDAAAWSEFLQQARRAGLLARLGLRLRAQGVALPPAVASHVESALRVIRAQRLEVARELRHIATALCALQAPVIVLKGAAYLAADLPAAEGRLFSDVDILVPKTVLARAESDLMLHGWMGTHHNAYDQRYYRAWMHELPPMQHVHRGTTLDVHHTIVPETGRWKPDALRLIEASRPLASHPELRMLAPADMVLHSMTHLFLNDETRHAMRDLSDLDALLRHFAAVEAGFWTLLLDRARELDLRRPLAYGLRYGTRILGTPVPQAIVEQSAAGLPSRPMRALMDHLWHQAFSSRVRPAPGSARAVALAALYARGHWLRMPPTLLARHLSIKALRMHERSRATTTPP